ncbi:MAG: hypothetical protein EOM10_14345, partial [Opitutae bacterium]|nr:hypothetical protein [Opitutae bacterium]
LGPGRLFPALTVPKMIEKMRESSSRAIISGDADALHAYLEKRKQEGVRVNINHLGEALLGETEARRRLETYIADLKDPAIEYISVKISTVYSQIHPLAFDHTVAILVERLSELYRVAAENRFVRADGTRVPKFVNLDMEEYRDLGITRAAGRWVFRHRDGTVVCELDPPTPGDLAWKLVTDSRIFPPHGGEGFTLDACVAALFHAAVGPVGPVGLEPTTDGLKVRLQLYRVVSRGATKGGMVRIVVPEGMAACLVIPCRLCHARDTDLEFCAHSGAWGSVAQLHCLNGGRRLSGRRPPMELYVCLGEPRAGCGPQVRPVRPPIPHRWPLEAQSLRLRGRYCSFAQRRRAEELEAARQQRRSELQHGAKGQELTYCERAGKLKLKALDAQNHQKAREPRNHRRMHRENG